MPCCHATRSLTYPYTRSSLFSSSTTPRRASGRRPTRSIAALAPLSHVCTHWGTAASCWRSETLPPSQPNGEAPSLPSCVVKRQPNALHSHTMHPHKPETRTPTRAHTNTDIHIPPHARTQHNMRTEAQLIVRLRCCHGADWLTTGYLCILCAQLARKLRATWLGQRALCP